MATAILENHTRAQEPDTGQDTLHYPSGSIWLDRGNAMRQNVWDEGSRSCSERNQNVHPKTRGPAGEVTEYPNGAPNSQGCA